ncbi:pyrroline-5-carboxylate reductase [Cellulomonas shaoxiangyii]|uniref:Pyrroline-5-carboxylate reductase n=1 Tax=Cellulomonas shaoxiangyii TaxID=2566013 RepID=A0A4P7SFN4_9CELL|nr:pyrroline-5-carboxylate reductase [Cellulomonas shaoxiangyii]QCB92812.1 pyrroline-5-carboxylate reductase [Cellulomonas shaoxiangyii]TGY83187.1 pyrroline-5-carboxylate reductase [Cellulomonas shaoxiangyii]
MTTQDTGRTPRVAVLGAGVMGGTLVAGLREAGWPGDRVSVADQDTAKVGELADAHGVTAASSNAEAVAGADVVLLAVKPGVVPAVLAELTAVLGTGALVVSVAAGVALRAYEDALPAGTPVVRVMPNTPALIGHGASAIAPGAAAREEHLALVERMLAATGLVVRVAEKDMDAVTALSGSGPAYVFYLVDALAEAGVLLGLTRDLATRLAVATVEGSAAMVAQTGEHPAVLRERVSSPGGTTVAGVAALDAHAVRAGVVAAVRAAAERSRELGRPDAG